MYDDIPVYTYTTFMYTPVVYLTTCKNLFLFNCTTCNTPSTQISSLLCVRRVVPTSLCPVALKHEWKGPMYAEVLIHQAKTNTKTNQNIKTKNKNRKTTNVSFPSVSLQGPTSPPPVEPPVVFNVLTTSSKSNFNSVYFHWSHQT